MNSLLRANLQVWHMLVAVAAIVLATRGVVWAQGETSQRDGDSVSEKSFSPSGDFRMSTASSTDSMYVHAIDGVQEVLKVEFKVPAGRKADIVGLFNAEAYKYPNGYAYLEFHLDSLDSLPLNPDQQWVADGYIYNGGYPTITGQGFLKNVGPGNHTLYAAISNTGGDTYIKDRSLILFANVR